MSTTQPTLTAAELALNDAWNEHLRAEFAAHNAAETMATMVANPRVNHVPVMIGGEGRSQVLEFYAQRFLPHIPPDTEITPVSRTIGQGRVVDELIVKFTHSIPMLWLLPGVAPTGKRVEVALVAVVQFAGNEVAHEHVYWDHASLLVQLGLIDPSGLPVVGVEGTRSVLDRSLPLNGLIDRALAPAGGR
jgi:carboxymethylenebutenolidase